MSTTIGSPPAPVRYDTNAREFTAHVPNAEHSFFNIDSWTQHQVRPLTQTLTVRVQGSKKEALHHLTEGTLSNLLNKDDAALYEKHATQFHLDREKFSGGNPTSLSREDKDVSVTEHRDGTSTVTIRHHSVKRESPDEHYQRLRDAGIPKSVALVRTRAMVHNKQVRHLSAMAMRNPAASSIVALVALGGLVEMTKHRAHHHRHHDNN